MSTKWSADQITDLSETWYIELLKYVTASRDSHNLCDLRACAIGAIDNQLESENVYNSSLLQLRYLLDKPEDFDQLVDNATKPNSKWLSDYGIELDRVSAHVRLARNQSHNRNPFDDEAYRSLVFLAIFMLSRLPTDLNGSQNHVFSNSGYIELDTFPLIKLKNTAFCGMEGEWPTESMLREIKDWLIQVFGEFEEIGQPNLYYTYQIGDDHTIADTWYLKLLHWISYFRFPGCDDDAPDDLDTQAMDAIREELTKEEDEDAIWSNTLYIGFNNDTTTVQAVKEFVDHVNDNSVYYEDISLHSPVLDFSVSDSTTETIQNYSHYFRQLVKLALAYLSEHKAFASLKPLSERVLCKAEYLNDNQFRDIYFAIKHFLEEKAKVRNNNQTSQQINNNVSALSTNQNPLTQPEELQPNVKAVLSGIVAMYAAVRDCDFYGTFSRDNLIHLRLELTKLNVQPDLQKAKADLVERLTEHLLGTSTDLFTKKSAIDDSPHLTDLANRALQELTGVSLSKVNKHELLRTFLSSHRPT